MKRSDEALVVVPMASGASHYFRSIGAILCAQEGIRVREACCHDQGVAC